MRAAFLDQANVINLRDHQDADSLQPDDVRVRIMASGICGSDVHFFEHGRIGPFIVEQPLVLGHETAGIIEEVGPNVRRLKVGDHVSIEPGVPCFQCETCKRGFYNLCSHVTFLGCPPLTHGSFRESMVHHHSMLHLLPKSMSFEEGAMIEPLAVAVHACRLAELRPNDLVAIFGAGPIGLLITQMAKVCGAQVVACDIVENRLQTAHRLRADQVLHSQKDSLHEAISSRWGKLPDVVFEAAGARESHQMALDLVAPGGRVVYVGWSQTPEIPLNVHQIGAKELTVKGQFRYRNVFPEAIALAQAGKIDLKSMITHRFSLENTAEALQFASRREPATVKIVITRDGNPA